MSGLPLVVRSGRSGPSGCGVVSVDGFLAVVGFFHDGDPQGLGQCGGIGSVPQGNMRGRDDFGCNDLAGRHSGLLVVETPPRGGESDHDILSFLRGNVFQMLELPPHLRSDLPGGGVGFWWRRQPSPERLQFALDSIICHDGGFLCRPCVVAPCCQWTVFVSILAELHRRVIEHLPSAAALRQRSAQPARMMTMTPLGTDRASSGPGHLQSTFLTPRGGRDRWSHRFPHGSGLGGTASDKNPLRQQERQTEPRRAAVPGFGPAESALLSDFVVLDWDPSSPLIRL